MRRPSQGSRPNGIEFRIHSAAGLKGAGELEWRTGWEAGRWLADLRTSAGSCPLRIFRSLEVAPISTIIAILQRGTLILGKRHPYQELRS
ncbi:unnamed protein product [Nezara viridula]|uniref:Uncharacterized protein n=1 Tax=Nezara viridula TaxID=85310 RepID=A0A9P0GZN6_NEZVI|nr:unnamed protein product [Nezara viridula]